MPIGLTNVPASFQHLINHIFQDILNQFVVAYLDSILIYSSNQAIHDHHVHEVLTQLCQHRLYTKLEKCIFEQISVEFLGFILSPDGVQIDPQKVSTIQEWAEPQRIQDIQRLMDLPIFTGGLFQTFQRSQPL